MTQHKITSDIRVFGVGGGGSNLVKYMQDHGACGADIFICNTSIEELRMHCIPLKLHLGKGTLGSGSNTEYATTAAFNSLDDIKKCLEGAKVVIIVSTLGGGTGTAVAPIIAKESKAMGIITLTIATLPFRFEGERKMAKALEGLTQVARYSDSFYIYSNQGLMDLHPELSIDKAFGLVDEIVGKMAFNLAESYNIDLSKPIPENVKDSDIEPPVQKTNGIMSRTLSFLRGILSSR